MLNVIHAFVRLVLCSLLFVCLFWLVFRFVHLDFICFRPCFVSFRFVSFLVLLVIFEFAAFPFLDFDFKLSLAIPPLNGQTFRNGII